MPRILQDFRGYVRWSSTQCGGEGFLANDLCQAEISQLDVEILVCKQNVFGLDIAVYNSSIMLKLVSKAIEGCATRMISPST